MDAHCKILIGPFWIHSFMNVSCWKSWDRHALLFFSSALLCRCSFCFCVFALKVKPNHKKVTTFFQANYRITDIILIYFSLCLCFKVKNSRNESIFALWADWPGVSKLYVSIQKNPRVGIQPSEGDNIQGVVYVKRKYCTIVTSQPSRGQRTREGKVVLLLNISFSVF